MKFATFGSIIYKNIKIMFYKSIYILIIIIIIQFSGCTPFTHISEDDFISSKNKENNDDEWKWYFVDGNGTVGINKNPSNRADDPQLTVYDSSLYAAWAENNEIKITVYNNNDNNPSWSFIDYSIPGDKPQLTVFNSKLYLIWRNSVINVAIYNGDNKNPSWTLISNNGLNKNINRFASYPQLTVYNSKLYATWLEDFSGSATIYNVRVAAYNGDENNPAWSFVDGENAYGLNIDPNDTAYCPQLTVFNSKLYIIWEENSQPAKIHVAVYNGDENNPAWSFVENNGNDCINKDITMHGSEPQLTVYKSDLYAIWTEFYNHQNGSNLQVTVAKYNGDDTSPSWQYVDSGEDYGINKNIKESADNPQLTSMNSNNPGLFAIWAEGSVSQIHVAIFNGENNSPMWSFIDSDNVHGINKDYNLRVLHPQLTAFNSKLYAIWQEDMPICQIRVAVYKK